MQNQAQLLNEKPTQSHDTYSWTVYTTWQMSFNKLSQPAAMLLQLCSFLHREGISEEIFSRAVRYTFPPSSPSKAELEKPLEFLSYFLGPTGKWDSLHFLKVTNELKAYSLVTFDPQRNVFSIHPLVHSWSRTTIPDQQLYSSIMSAIVGMSVEGIPDQHRQLASLQLISHIDSLVDANQHLTSDFGRQCGAIYYHVRRYEEAKELFQSVLEKRKKCLGDEHVHTLTAMLSLSATYYQLGEFHKAEELGVVVLEKQRKALGDDNPDTLLTIVILASTYHRLGEFHKAEELGVVVLEKQKKFLGDDHPDTLYTMGTLASTYHQLGEFHKSEELDVVVLEKQKRVLGDDHPDTLWTMSNLASTYYALGKFYQAEELGVVVLEKRRQVLGDDHPDTLRAIQNLALTYRCLNKLAEAEELEKIAGSNEEALQGSINETSDSSEDNSETSDSSEDNH
jgi:tetratricopeptide (TPR) repeat protein